MPVVRQARFARVAIALREAVAWAAVVVGAAVRPPKAPVSVIEMFQQLGKSRFYAGLPVITFPSSEHCIASTTSIRRHLNEASIPKAGSTTTAKYGDGPSVRCSLLTAS